MTSSQFWLKMTIHVKCYIGTARWAWILAETPWILFGINCQLRSRRRSPIYLLIYNYLAILWRYSYSILSKEKDQFMRINFQGERRILYKIRKRFLRSPTRTQCYLYRHRYSARVAVYLCPWKMHCRSSIYVQSVTKAFSRIRDGSRAIIFGSTSQCGGWMCNK